MSLVRSITEKIYSSSNEIFGGIGDVLFSMVGVFLLTDGAGFITGANEWADLIIKWGMAIIVGYGVLKILIGNILWPVLFGKKMELNIALLEKFYKFLRPIRIMKTIETTDEDEEKKTLEYLDRIEKTRQLLKPKTRRCLGMDFKKALEVLNANKFTILGVGAAGAWVILQGLGVVAPLDGELIAGVLQGNVEAVVQVGAALALGGLAINAQVGPGFEKPEAVAKRVAEKKQAKQLKLQKAADGENEVAIKKLAKQLGIADEQAKIVIKAKAEKAAKVLQEQTAKKEAAIVAALAKKLGVDEAQAKIIRKAQLEKAAQK